MNRLATRSGRLGIGFTPVGCLVILIVICAPGLWAQEDEGRNLGDLETQETASMRESTYKELAKAQEAAEAGNYAEAIAALEKLDKQDLNHYERSQQLNLYAYIYYAQDNIPRAISTYEQLLKQPELPEALQTSTVYTLSQLHFSQENWQASIDMLERWMQLTKEENTTAFEMMAQAYYQLGEYKKALGPAWKVVSLTQAAGSSAPSRARPTRRPSGRACRSSTCSATSTTPARRSPTS